MNKALKNYKKGMKKLISKQTLLKINASLIALGT